MKEPKNENNAPDGSVESSDLLAELCRLRTYLHARSMHPDYEYATTDGPRKSWHDEDRPPEGEGWEANVDRGRDGWERFDYHEEAYWRRRKVKDDPANALYWERKDLSVNKEITTKWT